MLAASWTATASADVVLSENFDSDNGFTKFDADGPAVFYNDSNLSVTPQLHAYWGIRDPNGVADDYDGDLPPAALVIPNYTGFSGNYHVGEFHDNGPNSPRPLGLGWSNHPVADLNNLSFSGLFAATLATGQAFESSDPAGTMGDYIRVQYQIDGNGYKPLLYFAGDILGRMARDADFDGVGESTLLTAAAQTFTVPIVGEGLVIDLRILSWTTAIGEQVAFDGLMINSVERLPGDYNGNGVVDGRVAKHSWCAGCRSRGRWQRQRYDRRGRLRRVAS
jgi:hypothetical protein